MHSLKPAQGGNGDSQVPAFGYLRICACSEDYTHKCDLHIKHGTEKGEYKVIYTENRGLRTNKQLKHIYSPFALPTDF